MAKYNLFDAASLVMSPTGIKDGKLYSTVPENGSGDFTFSRGSDIQATRVNASGLIEKAKVNLLTQSNRFDLWNVKNVTSGHAGYDGTNDAYLQSGAGRLERTLSESLSVYTGSVYVKAGFSDYVQFYIVGSAAVLVRFELIGNGTKVFDNGSISATIEPIANTDWYRISLTLNSALSSFRIYPQNDSSGTQTTDSSVYIQDAQLNHGLIAQDYVETTTTPVVEGLTADLPRLDYSGGASCPSLLLEPSRTNLLPHSEYAEGTFTLDNTSVSYNNLISPEGVKNAVLLSATGGSALNSMRYYNLPNTAGNYSYSFFLKAGTSESCRIRVHDGVNDLYEIFNPQTITEGTTSGDLGLTFKDFGNDWWRVTFSRSIDAAAAYHRFWFYPDFDGEDRNITIYGFQAEAGNYPTSYIPTYGTAAVRGEDAALKTGIDSLIDDNKGTLYMEVTPTNFEGDQRFGVSDNVGQNRIVLRLFNPSNLQLSAVINSSVEISISNSGYTAGNTYKIAGAWEQNNAVIYINGVQVATDTNCNTSASAPLNRISFDNGVGTAKWENPVKQTLYFPTRLTNAELAALTTI